MQTGNIQMQKRDYSKLLFLQVNIVHISIKTKQAQQGQTYSSAISVNFNTMAFHHQIPFRNVWTFHFFQSFSEVIRLECHDLMLFKVFNTRKDQQSNLD